MEPKEGLSKTAPVLGRKYHHQWLSVVFTKCGL